MAVHTGYVALENVLGYSAHQPAVFKAEDLKPVNDLKALVGTTVVCSTPLHCL